MTLSIEELETDLRGNRGNPLEIKKEAGALEKKNRFMGDPQNPRQSW